MSYTKQTWATGDTITAAKLNHMEDGIAGGGALMANLVGDALDKTWSEIDTAIRNGIPCLYAEISETETLITPITGTSADSGRYNVYMLGDVIYTATSPDGYPQFSD